MGRLYAAAFQNIAITAVQDLWDLATPATGMLCLHSVELGQSTDVTDAQEELLRIAIKRMTGAWVPGSGGGTITPAPLEGGAAASGITVERNNTTQGTGGTSELLYATTFNIRTGFLHIPAPEARYWVGPSDSMVVDLESVGADSITFDGTVIFEEFGT